MNLVIILQLEILIQHQTNILFTFALPSCFLYAISSFPATAQRVEIVEPVSTHIVVTAGKSFTLKCVGDVETDLMWTYNGQPLSAGGRILGECWPGGIIFFLLFRPFSTV